MTKNSTAALDFSAGNHIKTTINPTLSDTKFIYPNDLAVAEDNVKIDLEVDPTVGTFVLRVSLPCSYSGVGVTHKIDSVKGVQDTEFFTFSVHPSSINFHPSKVEMEGKDYLKTTVKIYSYSQNTFIPFTLNINFFLCSE